MPSYMLLYDGPPKPPDASHKGWRDWFESLGDKLADRGSPMAAGFVARPDGTADDRAASLNGYSIILAQDRDEVRELLASHPLLAAGSAYAIHVFEVPAK